MWNPVSPFRVEAAPREAALSQKKQRKVRNSPTEETPHSGASHNPLLELAEGQRLRFISKQWLLPTGGWRGLSPQATQPSPMRARLSSTHRRSLTSSKRSTRRLSPCTAHHPCHRQSLESLQSWPHRLLAWTPMPTVRCAGAWYVQALGTRPYGDARLGKLISVLIGAGHREP